MFHLFYDGAQVIRQQFFPLATVMKVQLGLNEFPLSFVVAFPELEL